MRAKGFEGMGNEKTMKRKSQELENVKWVDRNI